MYHRTSYLRFNLLFVSHLATDPLILIVTTFSGKDSKWKQLIQWKIDLINTRSSFRNRYYRLNRHHIFKGRYFIHSPFKTEFNIDLNNT